MLSLAAQTQQAYEEHLRRAADPFLEKVKAITRSTDEISTHALLDLIGLPNTTSYARRVSKTMRSLGFVPIKSRRFMPGGYRDTVTRGWARPLRNVAS
jgi:hypothetical protein